MNPKTFSSLKKAAEKLYQSIIRSTVSAYGGDITELFGSSLMAEACLRK